MFLYYRPYFNEKQLNGQLATLFSCNENLSLNTLNTKITTMEAL